MAEASKTQPPPEWALLFARGAIRIGMLVPEIEKQLIAKGLAPEEATSVVLGIIEKEVSLHSAPVEPSNRSRLVSLIVSAAICAVCVLLWYDIQRKRDVIRLSFVFLVAPMCSIWIPDLMNIRDSSWGAMSWVSGWILLFIFLAYSVIMWLVL